MLNFDFIKETYFANMESVPYMLKKGGEILINPILVKDIKTYEWAKQCLLINKNEINDINIIGMSYLKFLTNVVSMQDEQYKDMIGCLIHLCFNEEYFVLGDGCIIICDKDSTIKYVINNKEFDEISKIILSQNDIHYDDRYVSPDVKEMMEEYYKIKYKDVVIPSLEKKKAFVASKTGKTFKELNELPYREFDLLYDACKDSEMYFGNKMIQASFKYDIKQDIPHPLFEKEKDMYAELFEETSVLSGKGISGAEGLNAMNLQQMQQNS